MLRYRTLVPWFISALTAIGGCHGQPGPLAPPQAPAVPVSRPVQQEVTNYVEFTGRTDAVEAVDIRPRVTGYLVQMPFREGAEVKKGQLLFEVDPRPYQADLDRARGEVERREGMKVFYDEQVERYTKLVKKGAASQQELDSYRGQQTANQGELAAAKSQVEYAKLYLDFCTIRAPIDGRVSRYYLTLGNLVNQDQTLLTTLVSEDPMYTYFDTDEPTLLRLRRAVREGRIKPAEDGTNRVYMGLQDEEGFPHEGTINFVNNQVNPTTGSITMRGVFPNPKPPGVDRLLSPGMFVRVRLPISPPHPALLVIDRAIGSDQGSKYVYVVDAENKVQYRRVTTGPLQDNGLRVIADGLKLDDRVVVGGLQQIRPRMEVRPDETPMPTFGPEEKPEIRNPKSEGNSKSEIQTKHQT